MNLKALGTIPVALAAFGAGAQNFVVNGDFEPPETLDASSPPYFIPAFSGDTTSISGWTVGGRKGDVSVDIVHQEFFFEQGYPTFFAYSGVQMIDLAGSPGPGAIWQDIGTTPGEMYQLSFACSSSFLGGPHWLEVQWAGAVVDFFLAPVAGEWVVRKYTLMATSNVTRLMLGSDPNNFTDGGPVVDAVVVVPEPASLAALLASLGMLAFRRRTSLRRC